MTTIESRDLGNGYTGRIVHDSHCTESPYDGDSDVRIVVLHRRYSDPAEGACGSDPAAVAAWCKANAREWFTVPLWMFDHSGLAFAAGPSNPFHCPWDSGRVGIVALRKSAWGKGKGERNAKRLEIAQSIATEYGQWANGETFGFIIEDEDGNETDSCWGFIGMESVSEALQEAATGLPPQPSQVAAFDGAVASALV